MPAVSPLDTFIQNQGAALRANARPPAPLSEWRSRREALRKAMFAAMGAMPEKPCDLEPQVVGTLKHEGYRIEKVLLQSRPGVWVTASAYVPEPAKDKLPGVLVVHGHWAGARRDPVV